MSFNDLTAHLGVGVNLNAEVSSRNCPSNTSGNSKTVIDNASASEMSACIATIDDGVSAASSELEPLSITGSLTSASTTVMAANVAEKLKQTDANVQLQADVNMELEAVKCMPAGEFGKETIKLLSQYLRPPKVNAKDWEDMAEEMGFNYQREIKNFGLETKPVESVILAWSTKPGSTVGKLLEILETIERDDVLRVLQPLLVNDYKQWKRRTNEANNTLQDPEVSGNYPVQLTTEELRGITIGDHRSGPPEMFDAYVCFTEADLEFVQELVRQLELPPHNFKLCIDLRDLVPGGSYATNTAEIIQNRCNKMLVILSPEFLLSESCTFQTRFAVALEPGARTRRIIPIVVKSCTPPSIIRHITACDFTKKDLRPWLWDRLRKAVSMS